MILVLLVRGRFAVVQPRSTLSLHCSVALSQNAKFEQEHIKRRDS